MSAVMAVITNMLLDEREAPIPQPEGQGVVLSLNQVSASTYTVDASEQLYAEFELQQPTVELCFHITARRELLCASECATA